MMDLLAGLQVTRLVTDSRAVKAGDTFAAYPGEKTDGRQYIAQAIAQGANAVIWESQHFSWNEHWRVPNLGISDLRHKAGEIARDVYGAPSEKLWMVGVTGTNGKTSCCHWIGQALNDAAKKCALIGTLGNGFAGALAETVNTTPDAIRLQGLLAEYLHEGAAAVAMEVSSHALAQGRVNGVHFDVALLTNLSRDHLDYHGDMESYAIAKRRLFDWPQLKYAVINLDDEFGAKIATQLADREVEVIGYGLTAASLQLAGEHGWRMVYGDLHEMDAHGLHLKICSSWGAAALRCSLTGRFNAENILGVLAVLLLGEMSLENAVNSLRRVQSVAGRMQKIGDASNAVVIVDYAHTPDALEKVLLALSEANAVEGAQLYCVFGCGGDRDCGKRAMMGRIAARFAHCSIVTSDNPRSEEPQDIIDEIVSGMEGGRYEIVPDRRAAIERAVELAKPGDIVLIAGKGHENYQEIKGVKYSFNDIEVAGQALEKRRIQNQERP